jgi:hypothetical protein
MTLTPTQAAIQRAEEAKRKAKASVDPDEKLAFLTLAVDVLIGAVGDLAAVVAEHRQADRIGGGA